MWQYVYIFMYLKAKSIKIAMQINVQIIKNGQIKWGNNYNNKMGK